MAGPRNRIDERLAELVEMTQFPAQWPGPLSERTLRRTAATAEPDAGPVLNPRILLLDEPLGALDPLIRAGLQRDLSAVFARTGATVLLVTHDLVEASRLADRVCVMNAGRIVQQGPFAEILRKSGQRVCRANSSARRWSHREEPVALQAGRPGPGPADRGIGSVAPARRRKSGSVRRSSPSSVILGEMLRLLAARCRARCGPLSRVRRNPDRVRRAGGRRDRRLSRVHRHDHRGDIRRRERLRRSDACSKLACTKWESASPSRWASATRTRWH